MSTERTYAVAVTHLDTSIAMYEHVDFVTVKGNVLEMKIGEAYFGVPLCGVKFYRITPERMEG